MMKMKKLLALVLAVTVALTMGIATTGAVFAQEESGGSGQGTIVINNAAKGETYSVYKIFDATVKDNNIAYTGDIPESLQSVFEKTAGGNIVVKNGVSEEDVLTAVRTYVADANAGNATASVVSDGTALSFTGLPYGYYGIKSSQGTAVTITSTKPSVVVYDKNSKEPGNPSKTADTTNVNFGDKVTYTVQFTTSNFDGAGNNAKRIVSYTIEDTLPAFLSDVTVKSIYVDEDGNLETTNDVTQLTVQQFNEKKITVPWAENGNSLYKNGAVIVFTYEATVNNQAAIDGAGNTNTVKVSWKDEDGSNHDGGQDTETIYTYGLALVKTNEQGEALAGATFQFPFLATQVGETNVYEYAGAAEEGKGTEITTPADGVIIIKGLKSGENVTVKETAAPDGFNTLDGDVEITPTKTGKTETHVSWTIDENGTVTIDEQYTEESQIKYDNNNLSVTPVAVVNKSGAELPSTGGIGTTIFYILGALLVIGCGIVLIARRKTAAK